LVGLRETPIGHGVIRISTLGFQNLVRKQSISKARHSTITRLTICIEWIDEEGKHSKPHRTSNKMNCAMTFQTEKEKI
jgi:hypothetical protein